MEVATSTGGTAAPVVSAARAARALASAAGSAGDSWAWAISQGRLRFYRRSRVSVRRLPPRPRGVRRPARGWHIRGAGGDIATRDQHHLGQVGVFLEE